MNFTTRYTYRFYLLVLVLIGLVSMAFIIYGYGALTESQRGVSIGLSIVITLFCFVLPYYGFKNIKVVEVKNNTWTVSYPYSSKTTRITQNDIRKIVIMESIPNVGKSIDISLNDGSSIDISSLEIRDFDKLALMASINFKGLVLRTDYYKGKIKN